MPTLFPRVASLSRSFIPNELSPAKPGSAKEKHGDCEVPTSYPADPSLSHWVVNQRHAKKAGLLSEERLQKLAGIGFAWSVHKRGQKEEPVVTKGKVLPKPVRADGPEEHLYLVSGEYIQYNGTGPRPAKLERYIQRHGGELPPSITLPRCSLVFRLGTSDSIRVPVRKIKWRGNGPIPADVLEYLNENGALPTHS